MKHSAEFHGYIFRDVKLVGESEGMYLNIVATSWHQDKQENWIDISLTKEVLRYLALFDKIHDFGCCMCHILDLMAKHRLATNGNSYGCDVSATVCEKRSKHFPAQ